MEGNNLLTERKVLPTLLKFSVPFLIANIIQSLYGAVDLMVIGRYCSSESIAAVSTGTQVTQIITSLITGLTLGSTILVGKYTGMRAEEETKKTIGTTLSVFVIIAVVLTVAVLGFAEPVLRALKTPGESLALAKEYVVICGGGIIFICGYNAISAILRGYGDSKSPMMFVAVACVFNISCDIVLVKYLKMGVKGVALATVLSQGISMLWAVLYLNHKQFIFKFTLKNMRIEGRKVKELAKIGIPISLQECMVRLSFLYLTAVINSLGINAAAAVGIASKFDVFAMLPAMSVASALAAFTAQNYGAGKPKRAKTAVWAGLGSAVLIASCFFVWAQFSPQTMIRLFSQDEAIIQKGILFFRSCSYDYLTITFVFCLNGYLNGRGKTVFTMISCCSGALALRMPLIYLADTFYPGNLTVIGAVAPLVSGFMAIYTFLYVRRQFKLDMNNQRFHEKSPLEVEVGYHGMETKEVSIMNQIGIIGAMEEEVTRLKEQMEGISVTTKASMDFYQGILNKKRVVVVRSGIGKVNAAVCTQILADDFKVSCVINTGIAGSLKKEINIGDIVISTDALQHDVDAREFGYPMGQIPRMDVLSFEADSDLVRQAIDSCKEVNPDITAFAGRVVSGDQFIADVSTKENIIAAFGGYCTEMEGAAIAQTAYLNQIPFVIIRAISDKADSSATIDYPTFEKRAIEHSVQLVNHMVSNL